MVYLRYSSPCVCKLTVLHLIANNDRRTTICHRSTNQISTAYQAYHILPCYQHPSLIHLYFLLRPTFSEKAEIHLTLNLPVKITNLAAWAESSQVSSCALIPSKQRCTTLSCFNASVSTACGTSQEMFCNLFSNFFFTSPFSSFFNIFQLSFLADLNHFLWSLQRSGVFLQCHMMASPSLGSV